MDQRLVMHLDDCVVERSDQHIFFDLVATAGDFHHCHQHDQIGIHKVSTHLVVEVDEGEGCREQLLLLGLLGLDVSRLGNQTIFDDYFADVLQLLESVHNRHVDGSLLELLDKLVADYVV